MNPIPISPDEITILTDALGLVRMHKEATPAFMALFDKLAGAPVFPGYALVAPGSSLADLAPFLEGVECTDCGCPADELPKEGCTTAGCPLMREPTRRAAPDGEIPDLLALLRNVDRCLKGSQEYEHVLVYGTSQGVNGPSPADLVRAVLAGQPNPPLNPPGFLAIGANDAGQVVLNLPHDMTGHFIFSPSEAEQTADILRKQAANARGDKPGCAACDRGDYQLGHADTCPNRHKGQKYAVPGCDCPPCVAARALNGDSRPVDPERAALMRVGDKARQKWQDGKPDDAIRLILGMLESIGLTCLEQKARVALLDKRVFNLGKTVGECDAKRDTLQGEVNGVRSFLNL